MTKEEVKTDRAPAAIGPYSQGMKSGSLLFISGQLPLIPESGTMLDGSIDEQTRQIMNNIRAIVEKAGGSLENLVKTTIFMTDLSAFQEVNKAYGSFFQTAPPARAAVQVAALPLGARIEIEAIAVL